jgi:tetratricopeptide (TPR) repeat protein
MNTGQISRLFLGWTFGTVLLVCALSSAWGQAATTPSVDPMVQRRCQLAYVLLWSKNYPEAEKEFRKVLAADANYDEARLGLAQALERKGDLTAAVAEFERIKAGSPQYASALAGRARILTSQKDYKKALELYRTLKKESALTDDGRLGFAETLGLAGEYDEALAELAPLRTHPKLASDVSKLEGLVLFWSGRSAEAVPKLRESPAGSQEYPNRKPAKHANRTSEIFHPGPHRRQPAHLHRVVVCFHPQTRSADSASNALRLLPPPTPVLLQVRRHL